MMALIISGEVIFSLPFVIARVFRPTLLEVFQIDNLQLGTAFSLYGVIAMLAYFPGGALADQFSARKMMTVSLIMTSLGGVAFAQIPDLATLTWIYAFWGLTTILLFWAAIIRATRDWGGASKQGSAFGLLDGGRGLLAALLASISIIIFSSLLPTTVEEATSADKRYAFSIIIWIFTALTASAALLVWSFVPEDMDMGDEQTDAQRQSARVNLREMLSVLKNPAVWLQGLIIVTAYTGYKGVDNLGLFASDVYGMNEVEAAQISAIAFWTRPFAAMGAGLLGDRLGGMRTIIICFVLIIIGNGMIAAGLLPPKVIWALCLNIIVTCTALFGLRGLYFAIFQDAGVPPALTGTAVGVVSVIGYTPDIFMGPLNGYLTERYPGALGHQYFNAALAGFALIGLFSAIAFTWITRTRAQELIEG